MNSERSRILDMLARGVISVKECEEMLAAVEKRTDEKVKNDIEEARKSGPGRPLAVVLVIILALVALQALLFIVFPAFSFFFLGRRMGFDISILPKFIPLLFVAGIVLASTGFWIWMLIDCITRQPERFHLYFSLKHDTDKLVWLALIVLLNLVGALAYCILIFLPKKAASGAKTPEVEPYKPSPPARSLRWFGWVGIALMLLLALYGVMRISFGGGDKLYILLNAISFVSSVSVTLLVLWTLVFWIWMLIDCGARDRRDFGAFTRNQATDKLIWLALILVTFIFGGLSYHMVIRRNPAAGVEKYRNAFRSALIADLTGMAILIAGGLLFHYVFMPEVNELLADFGVSMPSMYFFAARVGAAAIVSGIFLGALGMILYVVSRFSERSEGSDV